VALLENEKRQINIKVNGLEEEISDAAANLQDAITTNDALTEQVKKLEHEQQTCKCVWVMVKYYRNICVHTKMVQT